MNEAIELLQQVENLAAVLQATVRCSSRWRCSLLTLSLLLELLALPKLLALLKLQALQHCWLELALLVRTGDKDH